MDADRAVPFARRDALIIEDDNALREVLCDVLRANGYEVFAAASLEEARAWLAQRKPTVVLLDMRVEGHSMERLLEHLTEAINPHTTVVMAGSARGRELADRYGVLCVGKPFDIDELCQRLDRALDEGAELVESARRLRHSHA